MEEKLLGREMIPEAIEEAAPAQVAPNKK